MHIMMYHLPGNVISATVGLVYINLQPNMSLARLFSDNSGSLQKLELGAPSSPATPRKQFEFLFVSTSESDLTLLALLTSEI